MKRLISLEQKWLLTVIAISVMFYSCKKEKPVMPQPVLSFNMGAQAYSFYTVNASARWSCGYRLYEISVLTHDNQFFKINFTDVDTLRPGIFIMDEVPTNSVPGSCTFWYSGKGRSLTARHFSIIIISYSDRLLNGNFSGGGISSGSFNNIKIVES